MNAAEKEYIVLSPIVHKQQPYNKGDRVFLNDFFARCHGNNVKLAPVEPVATVGTAATPTIEPTPKPVDSTETAPKPKK